MQPKHMHVLITGACGGIGKALAMEFANAGASLFLTGRDQERMHQLETELMKKTAAGQSIQTSLADLTNKEQRDDLIRQLKGLDAPINTIINNAGVLKFQWFEDLTERDISLHLKLNTHVPMILTHSLLPLLKQQNEARIVNVSSTFGAIGFPGYSVYCASKYATRGFSEALGRELADTKVSVGSFLPRATKTAINSNSVVQLNKEMNVAMDDPDVVAKALFHFICSKKTVETFGWPEKLLVKLNALFPSIVGLGITHKLPLIKRHARQQEDKIPNALQNH